MARRFVVTMLGALACGTKTSEEVMSHNPPQPITEPTPPQPPAPQPAESAPSPSAPSPGEPILRNALDAQGRTIFRAGDGSCYVQLPPKDPPPGSPPLSFRPMESEATECPTSMKQPGWESCIAGRILEQPQGSATGGQCLCTVFGNPPPPPRIITCPREDG